MNQRKGDELNNWPSSGRRDTLFGTMVSLIARGSPASWGSASGSFRPAPIRSRRMSGPVFPRRPSQPIFLKPQASRLGAFNLQELPTSIAFGAAGIGAMMLSSIIPDPIKTIFQVSGIGLLAFGLLDVFSGPASADSDLMKPDAEPFTPASLDDLLSVSAKIVSPGGDEKVPVEKPWVGAWTYPLQVLWWNPLPKKVIVPFQVDVVEEPPSTLFEPGFSLVPYAERFQGIVFTGTVEIGPSQAKPMTLHIPKKMPAILGLSETVYLNLNAIYVPDGSIINLASVTFELKL